MSIRDGAGRGDFCCEGCAEFLAELPWVHDRINVFFHHMINQTKTAKVLHSDLLLAGHFGGSKAWPQATILGLGPQKLEDMVLINLTEIFVERANSRELSWFEQLRESLDLGS